MSNETLNRNSATPSLTSKQISMSSLDISSLVNEQSTKVNKPLDVGDIDEEQFGKETKEMQGDNRVFTCKSVVE